MSFQRRVGAQGRGHENHSRQLVIVSHFAYSFHCIAMLIFQIVPPRRCAAPLCGLFFFLYRSIAISGAPLRLTSLNFEV
jgi:hypothetical protein